MTVTVPEIKTGNASTTVATNISVTTSLVTSDLLVLVTSRYSGGGAFTPTGLGTWTLLHDPPNGTAEMGHRVWTLTGVTGTGTVTIPTHSGSATTPGYTLFVVRGLPAPNVDQNILQWTSLASGAVVEFNNVYMPADRFGIAVGHFGNFSGSGAGFPSATDPAGWVVDYNTTGNNGLSVAHFISSTEQYVDFAIKAGTAPGFQSRGLITFGVPDGERRLIASALEVAATSTPSGALRSDYSEVAATSTPSGALRSDYSEVAATVSPAREIAGVYVEIGEHYATSQVPTALGSAYLEVLTPAPQDQRLFSAYAEVVGADTAVGVPLSSAYAEVVTPVYEGAMYANYVEVVSLYTPIPEDAWEGWGVVF